MIFFFVTQSHGSAFMNFVDGSIISEAKILDTSPSPCSEFLAQVLEPVPESRDLWFLGVTTSWVGQRSLRLWAKDRENP